MDEEKENKTAQISFWLSPELNRRARIKADRDAVNLSALLRGFLREWTDGEAGAESPAPQKGKQ